MSNFEYIAFTKVALPYGWLGKNVFDNIWMDFRKEYRDEKSI